MFRLTCPRKRPYICISICIFLLCNGVNSLDIPLISRGPSIISRAISPVHSIRVSSSANSIIVIDTCNSNAGCYSFSCLENAGTGWLGPVWLVVRAIADVRLESSGYRSDVFTREGSSGSEA